MIEIVSIFFKSKKRKQNQDVNRTFVASKNILPNNTNIMDKIKHHSHKLNTYSFLFIPISIWILLGLSVSAQIPTGYYDDADGLTGPELKTALKNIIDNHNSLDYGTLWIAFEDTDKKANGKVWDMYSDIPGGTPPYEFTFGSDQCGNYSGEGDCYNREHSFPRSWFNDAYPMESDLFHIVATDGYVNGQRGSFPFGEVGSATWTSLNGSKKGNSSYPGYSGTVFEPIDEYKGDFARGYFYMVTRYEDEVSTWNSPMLNGSDFPAFSEWALSMLLEWHEQDPVSIKEVNRNNAIYLWQNNRNPFIDNPLYVEMIWGDENPPVTFTSVPVTTIHAGSNYSYSITASGGNGSPVMVSYTQKPDWLTFSGGSAGAATLSGTPTEADEGFHQVELTATDGETVAEQSINIEVVIEVPEIIFVSLPIITTITGQQYSYTVEVTVDGASSMEVEFRGTTIPTWLNLNDQNNGTAMLFGAPTLDDVGPNDVEITAIFGEYEATQSFTIQVNEAGGGASFTETFTQMPSANSAYVNRSWIGDHGIEWNATQARTDLQIDGRALCFKDSGEPYLISDSLTGGIMSVSFDHQQKFSGSGGAFTLFINDQQVGEPVLVTTDIGSASFNTINISGDFVIKVVSNGQSRVAIDNLFWTRMESLVQAPVFGNIYHTPDRPMQDEEVTFTSEISDPDGTIASAVLHYGNTSGSPDQQIAMTWNSGNAWQTSTTLPLIFGDVFYHIEATDNDDNTSRSPEFIIIPATPLPDRILTINTEGSGTTDPEAGTHYYLSGTVVDINATPAEGWVFEKWEFTGSESTNLPLQITMDDDYTITAHFLDATSTTNLLIPVNSVYPNPFNEQLTITNGSAVKRITIINSLGQAVLIKAFPGDQIDTQFLKHGLYLVKMETLDGKFLTIKAFKN